jgi:hypothetical protein
LMARFPSLEKISSLINLYSPTLFGRLRGWSSHLHGQPHALLRRRCHLEIHQPVCVSMLSPSFLSVTIESVI